jgi:hypothetical protein
MVQGRDRQMVERGWVQVPMAESWRQRYIHHLPAFPRVLLISLLLTILRSARFHPLQLVPTISEHAMPRLRLRSSQVHRPRPRIVY